ncbi:hypothetical protein [Streptomyces yaizuensis]|uniref:Integral membrane protein n=1 Tax=Streptomyces yaizuensis TaxID=2989713 RepID=A0ABQ5NVJ2_9ACTN|nr:hypothetical protein [Streptomyces sp. YSPA8]GLF94011.1 hypothetical protein SYYSPA8_06960 [Streptomyces sp. YSPA8]
MGGLLPRGGDWDLALVCACYLIVVYITSRGLIAAPRYRQLQGRIRDCRARADVLGASGGGEQDPARTAALTAVHARLDDLERGHMVVWRLRPNALVVAIPLSKLAAAWRVLHAAERQLLRLEPPEETTARVLALRLRLAASPERDDAELAASLATAEGPAARALLIAATEHVHRRDDTAAEQEYEQQRIALWLAITGLGAVLLLGLVFDHRLTMLMGALGGFLSPVIGVLRSQRPSSWGVLVLAPVGGALAASGGLLLVRMLSDPELNLLGEVFLANSWDAPTRPLALAIALLFGFSGTLFSRLALTATGQLAPPRPRV